MRAFPPFVLYGGVVMDCISFCLSLLVHGLPVNLCVDTLSHGERANLQLFQFK